MENKDRCHDRSRHLCDITDGTAYKKLYDVNGFLYNTYNITGIFNTDGVNLYSSSKIELWPIFMAINELKPSTRFSRENMLLVGLWQGKGKPPFCLYMKAFSEEMNKLFHDGIEINVLNQHIKVKLAVICGTVDLPAKAGILNMTQYNGSDACITCEETGLVVQQGKGHSRCYPYRDSSNCAALRNTQDVKSIMQRATEKKRIKGFRGQSGLLTLQMLDLVDGIVPDYMHCVLLGTTKSLLCKWLSPAERGESYFIGNHLKKISKRLCQIKPPDFIERLPRDLEKHYSNLKATELQSWLLFYSLPCLEGILPETYLGHFSKLSEAIFILLGDEISEIALNHAEKLLDSFYANFEELYSRGSCGLNVHNAGRHLVYYVKRFGPLWAWSCFPFEDSNASLLQSTHGTGSVMKQVFEYRQAQSYLRNAGFKPSHEAKTFESIRVVGNCSIFGSIKQFPQELKQHKAFAHIRTDELKQVSRILVNGRRLFSAHYTRMSKRTCNVIIYDNEIASVENFLFQSSENVVWALVKLFEKKEELHPHPAGKHLLPVQLTDKTKLIPVEKIKDTLVIVPTENKEIFYVSKRPNRHGHAVFK